MILYLIDPTLTPTYGMFSIAVHLRTKEPLPEPWSKVRGKGLSVSVGTSYPTPFWTPYGPALGERL